MKRITLITLCFSTLLATACSNDREVPNAVKKTFNEKYPNATHIDWEQEDDAEWEAEFKLEKTEYSAKFTTEGKWIETESEIKVKLLPQTVLSAIAEKFPNYEIEEAELINSPIFKNAYEIEVEANEIEYEIIVDADGKIISEKEENEDED